jgi:hypothetical protein
MKKVFCKNCKYYHYHLRPFASSYHACLHESNIKIHYDPVEGETKKEGKPHIINKNCDCELFEIDVEKEVIK